MKSITNWTWITGGKPMLWSISGGVIIFVLGVFIFKARFSVEINRSMEILSCRWAIWVISENHKNWRYFICSIRSCYDNTTLYFEIITFRLHDERQINFRRDIDAGYRDYNDCILQRLQFYLCYDEYKKEKWVWGISK